MAPPEKPGSRAADFFEGVGRSTGRGFEQFGYGASLFWQVVYWVFVGHFKNQRVRAAPVFAEAMEAGIRAIPIIAVLSMTIGIMLALQGIHALKAFGASTRSSSVWRSESPGSSHLSSPGSSSPAARGPPWRRVSRP